MPKEFELPGAKFAVWDYKTFDLTDKFKKITDPLIRLAVYLKDEGETCGDRYHGMEDQDWLNHAKQIQQILTGKYEEIE